MRILDTEVAASESDKNDEFLEFEVCEDLGRWNMFGPQPMGTPKRVEETLTRHKSK